MTEAERVRLYNDLCDYEQDLQLITIPPRTKEIDIIRRAITYVRGTNAHWIKTPLSQVDTSEMFPFTTAMECSSCHFANGRSDFRICPQCSARMR